MRRLLLVSIPFVTLTGPVANSANAKTSSLDGGSAAPSAEQRALLHDRQRIDDKAKTFIRRNAELFYGADCPGLTVPDAAFLAVEIDGVETTREVAVTFGRARCRDHGHNMLMGTGGVLMQFWQLQGDRPSLLLEQPMHGFTGQAPYLVTMQHGSACPGGAGPSPCRVIYRWDSLGRRLETESRQLLDDGWVRHDDKSLTGASPCTGRERRGICR